jgi:uncharacterized protein (TIGR02246 family)
MRRSLRNPTTATLLALALTVLVAACSDGSDTVGPTGIAAAPQSSTQSVRGDASAISDLVATATAAWAAKDAAAYAAIYAEDLEFVNPLGVRSSGRQAFEATHVFLFGGPFAGSTQSIDVVDVNFLTGTIATVLQDVTLTGYAFLPPGLPSSNGVVRTSVTWVVVKRQGEWQIMHQQMTPKL